MLFHCQSNGLFLCIGDVHPVTGHYAYTDVHANAIVVAGFDGRVVARVAPPAIGYYGYPTFSPGGRLAFVSAVLTATEDFPLPRPGAISYLEPPYDGLLQTLVTGDGIAETGRWLDDTLLVYNVLDATGRSSFVLAGRDGFNQPLESTPYFVVAILR